MKARNPEAIKLEHSREVRLLPETPEELRQAQYASFWPPAAQQTVVKPQGSDLAKEMGPKHQDS